MKRSLKNIAYHKGKANLWRILKQPISNILWLEYRSDLGRDLFFEGLEISTGELLYEKRNPGIPWEGGIASVCPQGLLFHLKKAEGSPVFIGLAYSEFPLERMNWQDEELYLRDIKEHIVVVEKEDKIFEIDVSQGTLVKSEPLAHERSSIMEAFHYPEQYQEDSDFFKEVKAVLRDYGIHRPLAMIDYLEIGHYVFIGYYESSDQGMVQRLLALDADGVVVDNYILAQSLKNPGRDTFFVLGKYLVLVIDKTDLAVYEMGI